MIFASVKVYTPEGWREAREIESGDSIYSWRGKKWFVNTVQRVQQGQARTVVSLICLDGIAPTIFNCSLDQALMRRWGHVKADKLMPGQTVFVSEGTNVFSAEVAVIERVEAQEPQAMVAFELAQQRPYLAGGFLCRG